MAQWIKALVRSSDIPKRSKMARVSRTVYPGERNKGLSSTFQTLEEGRSVQQSKRRDKHGDKDEDNSPKNVNNVHNTSSQKYRDNGYCHIINHYLFVYKSFKKNFIGMICLQLFGTSKRISYLPTPPLGQDITQGQFLSGV